MTAQYFIQGLFAVAGTLSILAALFNWDWFFTAQNTQFVVRNVGRNRARLFYGLLGVLMVGAAVFFLLNSQPQ